MMYHIIYSYPTGANELLGISDLSEGIEITAPDLREKAKQFVDDFCTLNPFLEENHEPFQ